MQWDASGTISTSNFASAFFSSSNIRPLRIAKSLGGCSSTLLVRYHNKNRIRNVISRMNASGGENYSEAEVKEMNDLIVSLSKESNDELRRERVASVFEEALARPNGDPKLFCDLFDETLTIVGSQVQDELRAAAAAKGTDGQKEEEEASAVASEAEKAPGEKQIWALVDIMVQSKTIAKKASGELGSNSSFG